MSPETIAKLRRFDDALMRAVVEMVREHPILTAALVGIALLFG